MHGDSQDEVLKMFRNPRHAQVPEREVVAQDESEEEACPAFGYLRGTRDRALMLEFRLRSGNVEALSYNLLGSVRFNPSAGVLLRFGGDVTTLVLIAGSNLDVIPKGRTVNLTDRGLMRQRITWVRELDEDEVRRAPKGQPVIDRLLIAECENEDAVKKWIALTVPAFARSDYLRNE